MYMNIIKPESKLKRAQEEEKDEGDWGRKARVPVRRFKAAHDHCTTLEGRKKKSTPFNNHTALHNDCVFT